jgi:hypothetical protein
VEGDDAGEDERAGSSPVRTADAPLTFGAADHEPDEAHPTIDVFAPDGHWHTAHFYRRKDHPASVVMWLGVVRCGTFTFVGGALTDADGGTLAWRPAAEGLGLAAAGPDHRSGLDAALYSAGYRRPAPAGAGAAMHAASSPVSPAALPPGLQTPRPTSPPAPTGSSRTSWRKTDAADNLLIDKRGRG